MKILKIFPLGIFLEKYLWKIGIFWHFSFLLYKKTQHFNFISEDSSAINFTQVWHLSLQKTSFIWKRLKKKSFPAIWELKLQVKKKNVGGENSKLENKKSCLCFPHWFSPFLISFFFVFPFDLYEAWKLKTRRRGKKEEILVEKRGSTQQSETYTSSCLYKNHTFSIATLLTWPKTTGVDLSSFSKAFDRETTITFSIVLSVKRIKVEVK